jgi:F420-dependent oxidoreductase-like protein
MRIGIFLGEPSGDDPFATLQAGLRSVADDGFTSAWLPQIFGADALTCIAVAGREVDIELGTAVVPTYPRHPLMLAAQALTTNAAVGGRLVLGIGLSHQIVIESMLGMSFEKPARHMREYLSILLPLIREGKVSFEGETLSTNGGLTVPGARPFPVLVAALAPLMLKIAGEMADGTVTWMTGPDTIAGHIAPRITDAAANAGRPAPRIVCALPVCVTDDVDAARERASRTFAIYGQLPSYRAMLDKEGAGGPADVAIVGTEDEVRQRVAAIADTGATDFVAVEYATGEERDRTRAVLRSLL